MVSLVARFVGSRRTWNASRVTEIFMRWIVFLLSVTVSGLWAQYKIEISPLLTPYTRAGTLTPFQIRIHETLGKPFPTQGKLEISMSLNGLIFSKHFRLEDHKTPFFILEALVPPRLPKGNDFRLFFSGAIHHQESIPATTLLPSFPPQKKLVGIFHSTPTRQEWWKTFLTPLSHQLCPLETSQEAFSDFRFLDAFNFLIWEPASPAQNTATILKQLQEWLFSGGILLATHKTLETPEFKEFFQLPNSTVFALGPTLGEKEQWEKFQIHPEQHVFWSQNLPVAIRFNYGAGVLLLLNENHLPDPKIFFQSPFWNRKTPSVFAPESYLPFQHEFAIPSAFRWILLGGATLYCVLYFFIRNNPNLKQKTLALVSLALFGAYWIWGSTPVVTQTTQIFWISPRGTAWQKLIQYRALRLTLLEIPQGFLPQFYETRDFDVPEQRALDILPLSPFWHFQSNTATVSPVPLAPPGSLIWERRGHLEKTLPFLIRESAENLLDATQLWNPTEAPFHFVFCYHQGKWGYLETLSPRERRPLLWSSSLEETMKTIPAPYQRVMTYLTQTTISSSSKIIAFPESPPDLGNDSKYLDFSPLSVYVALE